MNRTMLGVACALAVLGGAAQVKAEPLLFIHDGSFNLGTVDVATGAVSIIGNMGVQMTDIAFDPDGNLFGVSFSDVYSINKNTAQVSLIGAHGIAGGNALLFGSDGTLYAAGADTTNLFTVNPNTGESAVEFDMGFQSAGDLAFNSGRFFLAARLAGDDALVEIDLGVPSATSIGSFGFDTVFGLATGSDGVLYALSGTNVLTVDIGTGAATVHQSFGGQGMSESFGSSFFTEAGATESEVPEPATLALVGLSALAMGYGVRRRPRVA